MAGKRAAVFLLGSLVLAVVGGGLFLALSQPDGVDEFDEPPVENAAVDDTAPDEDPGSHARRRAERQGTSSIIGVVELGATDAPAVGQAVTLSREGADTLTRTTDASGAFAFEKLPAGGPYEVAVVAEGLAPVRMPGIALDRREVRDVGTLVLDTAMRITVFVKRLDDTPVAGATVEAFTTSTALNVDWTKRLAQIGVEPVAVDSAVTDERGRVVFTDLAVGTWTITAEKEGLDRTGKTVAGRSREPEPAPITIYLSRSFGIVGKISDHKGRPLPGALVLGMASASAWSPTAAPLNARATADEDGEYRLGSLSRGDVAIWVAQPGGVPSVYATVRVPDVERFDMVLIPGGTLQGTVTEQATGEPVAEAEIRAQSWNGFSSRIAVATTGEDGRYVIDTLLEGNVNQITVEKDGFVQVREPGQQQWQQVPLNRDDTIVRDIVLRKAATLSGVVSGPNGAIAGARVIVYTNAGLAGFQNKMTTTDGAGKYRFDGVDSGRSILVVTAEGHYQKGMPEQWWQALQQGTAPEEYSVELVDGEDATQDIVLTAGTVVRGTVKAADGTPLEGATVRSSGGSLTGGTKSAADGRFRLEGVIPAPQVAVNVTAEGFAAASKQMVISEGVEPEEITIEMVRAGKVRGTVRAKLAGELVDAYVQVAPATGNAQPQTWPPQSADARWRSVPKAPVLADGTYEIEMPLAAGKFVVRASALGFEPTSSQPQDVVPGQAWYEVDVTLGEGSTLRGRVTDAETGVPVAGALVRLGAAGAPQMYWNGMNQIHRQHPVVAVTEQDGRYEIANAAKGSYTLSAQADGFVDATQTTKVPPQGDANLELQPELEIRGVVKFKDGTPVQGAQVAATKEGDNVQQVGGWNPSQSITGSDGSFLVGGLGKGNYSIQVSQPWGSSLNIKPHTHGPVAAGTSDVEVTVEGGLAIAGVVVDSEGQPVSGVFLNAQPEGSGGGVWRNTQSDKDGTFRIVGLGEGTFTVHVQTNWAGGGNFQAKRVAGVRPGTEDLRIELVDGFEIEGTVIDDENEPVANLSITAQRLQQEGEQQQNFSGWANTNTDAAGHFTLRGLSPGKYLLNGQENAGVPRVAGRTPGGRVLLGGGSVAAGTKGVRLTLSLGATIEGTVTTDSGAPVAGAMVGAQPKGQGMLNRSAASDENGRFVVSGLLPDLEYQMTANHNEYKSATLPAVRAGTTNVDLVMAAGMRVTGLLLDADGAVAGQKPIMFTQQKEGGGTGSRSMVTTKPDGTFDKGGLDEGTYKVQAWKLKELEGGMRSGEWVDLGEVDVPATDVTLRLPRSD